MTWADALTALSVAAIALVLVAGGVAHVLLLQHLRRLLSDLSKLTQSFERDGRPALESLRKLVDDAEQVVTVVKSEVNGLANTSQGLRKRLERGANAVEDRLSDLSALLDVVQEEVEDTALDLAAALRTARGGGKWFRRMKRALLRRGR